MNKFYNSTNYNKRNVILFTKSKSHIWDKKNYIYQSTYVHLMQFNQRKTPKEINLRTFKFQQNENDLMQILHEGLSVQVNSPD